MFVKLDRKNQSEAARSEILRVVEEVNPELANMLDLDANMSLFDQLKARASRTELNAIREGVRPLAERSFDDPLARYLFGYFPGLGVKNPDISYVVDEMERLKDEEMGPELDAVLNFDLTILCEVMSASNIDQLDRLLRIESDTIAGQQSVVIQTGVRKKFFREAPQLQWLAASRFRGRNKYLDGALDRMLSASDNNSVARISAESEPLADDVVSGPLPIYVSVPAGEYSSLLSADTETRAGAVFDAMEEETYPVADIDKLHAATHRVLVELVGEDAATAIVYGGADLDPQQETDGLRGNDPGDVDKLSSLLGDIDFGAMEDSYAVGELATIYAAAAERGDAIAVLMN